MTDQRKATLTISAETGARLAAEANKRAIGRNLFAELLLSEALDLLAPIKLIESRREDR